MKNYENLTPAEVLTFVRNWCLTKIAEDDKTGSPDNMEQVTELLSLLCDKGQKDTPEFADIFCEAYDLYVEEFGEDGESFVADAGLSEEEANALLGIETE